MAMASALISPRAVARVSSMSSAGEKPKVQLVGAQIEQGRVRTDSLVAVHEGVVHHERVHERGGLGGVVFVEIFAAEGHLRTGDAPLPARRGRGKPADPP